MTSESEVDAIFSPIQLVVVLLIGLLIASPFIAHLAVGWGFQPALEVGEPVSTVSSDATVIGYESLSQSQQGTFREASGASSATLESSFPDLDYVKLDGSYYPTQKTTHVPEDEFLILNTTMMLGFGLLLIGFVGTIDRYGIAQQLKQGLYHVAFVTPPAVSATAIALVVGGVLLLVTPEYTMLELSQQPVSNPKLANAQVQHITNLSSDSQSLSRAVFANGTERPRSELTYQAVYLAEGQIPPQSQAARLAATDYIRTDGELFHVRQIEKTPNLLYGVDAFIACGTGVLAYMLFNALRDASGE